MPALIPAILKGILFLFLFLIGLLLFLLLLLLFVPFRYRGSGAREEKQLSGCFSVSWLFSLLRFSLSYATEKKAEFFVLGFRVYHSDETEDTADAAKENDFDYPESMASEDFEPDTAERKVVEEKKAVVEEEALPSEHFEVTEPVSDEKKLSPQREEKQRQSVSEEEQCSMRRRGRSRRRFRAQREKLSIGIRKLQDFIRSAETEFDFFQDERTQRFLQFLKRKVFRFLRELLPRRMSGALRFGFADPALTGQGAALAAMLLPLYRDNLEIEPLFDREELSGKLAFRGRIQLFVFLFGAAQLWFHPDFRFVYRHLRGKDRRKNREDTHG